MGAKYVQMGSVAGSIPLDEEKCGPIGSNVQHGIETLCNGPLAIAECVALPGNCGFTFKDLRLLYSKDGCTLLQAKCEEE